MTALAPTTNPIDLIEDATRRFGHARGKLAESVGAMETEINRVKHNYISEIKMLAATASDAKAQLEALIETNPDSFIKPKTITIDGIKVGYRKAKGKVVILDEEKTIARIREQLPTNQADLLIKIKENVHKPSVYDLTASDLKRLGIQIENDVDEVVIKATDANIDKIVDQMLADDEHSE